MKPSEDTKTFWLMIYSIEAFREVIWACNYLLQSRPHLSDSMFRAMMTSIYTHCGRPFHKNFGVGNLKRDIVPEQYKSLHDRLMLERDKIHAHRDGAGVQSHIGNANQVRLLRLENGFTWCTSTYLSCEDDEIMEIGKLCSLLIKHLDKETDRYQEKCLPIIRELSVGEYQLNLDSQNDNLFLKVESVLPPNDQLDLTPL